MVLISVEVTLDQHEGLLKPSSKAFSNTSYFILLSVLLNPPELLQFAVVFFLVYLSFHAILISANSAYPLWNQTYNYVTVQVDSIPWVQRYNNETCNLFLDMQAMLNRVPCLSCLVKAVRLKLALNCPASCSIYPSMVKTNPENKSRKQIPTKWKRNSSILPLGNILKNKFLLC